MCLPQRRRLAEVRAAAELVERDALGKVSSQAGEGVCSGDLVRQRAHDALRDREAAVVERFAAALLAGVAVAGVEKQQVARTQGEFLTAAGKATLTALDKAEDVMLVKVGGEGLHDALEAVGLKVQFVVIDRAAALVLHAHPSLAGLLYHRGGKMACTISSFFVEKKGSPNGTISPDGERQAAKAVVYCKTVREN